MRRMARISCQHAKLLAIDAAVVKRLPGYRGNEGVAGRRANFVMTHMSAMKVHTFNFREPQARGSAFGAWGRYEAVGILGCGARPG